MSMCAFFLRFLLKALWGFLLLFMIVNHGHAQMMTTILGTGLDLDFDLRKEKIGGLCVDAYGNVFVSMKFQHRVLKINPSGEVTVVAGTGVAGYSGDGGPATEAQLQYPGRVFVDALGHLYIGGSLVNMGPRKPRIGNHRIRKVDAKGNISTLFEGQGVSGIQGDGGLSLQEHLYIPGAVFVDEMGHIFVADTNNNRVYKIDTMGNLSVVAGIGRPGYSGDGGLATLAQLHDPADICVDKQGNLLIADRRNHCIRKVDSAGVISTLVGTGAAGFSGDGGPAAEAQLRVPSGLFVDEMGSIFITDRGNCRIRKVDPFGNIWTIAGTGELGYEIVGPVWSSSTINADPSYIKGSGGPAMLTNLSFPEHIGADALGNIFITDGPYVQKIAGPHGAYAIRQHQKNAYLIATQDDGMTLQVVDQFQPERLESVWNMTSLDDGVSIWHASSGQFLQSLTDTLADNTGFWLVNHGEAGISILSKDGTKTLVANDRGKVSLQELGTFSGDDKWNLVPVGPVQKAFVQTLQETGFDKDPGALDGKQVLLGVDGYWEGQAEGGVYHADFRWLRSHHNWLTLSDSLIAYRRGEVFTLEYVGHWESIFDEQNAYAKTCQTLRVGSQVFVLKGPGGAYVMPEGVTTQLNDNMGMLAHSTVRLSVGEPLGNNVDAEVSARDKAALFVVHTQRHENGAWVEEDHLYLDAVAHQWNQSPSFFSSVFKTKAAMPIWGIVAPVSLSTLRDSHHLQQVWPTESPLPEDHWITTYPLGVSMVVKDNAQGVKKLENEADYFYTNMIEKERLTNAWLGMTTGWRYWFYAHPETALRLFVLME